ncbi:hypothetical protein BWI92_16585 [Flectobacillus sp. BAB-3569]|nr:hypothetical protein BWI92_16585 [Flectobacillus sp. BAB-3569]
MNLARTILYTDSDMLLEIPFLGFIMHDFSDLAQGGFFLLSAVYVYWKIKNEKLKHQKIKEGEHLNEEPSDD